LIGADTSIYGLIGRPLDHSISPQIQNAAFKKMGLHAVYVCFRLKGSVPRAVRCLSDLGVKGINVTIPYKTHVMDALDWIEDNARVIGAVNVIKFDERIEGYNTDITASTRSLKEALGRSLSGLRVLIIGAGGSARAVSYGLASEGCDIKISNRTPKRARDLAREISERASTKVLTVPYGGREMIEEIAKCDVLVNATPVGMYPHTDESIVAPQVLHPGLVVMDLVYNPPATRLLREAERIGCRTVGGLRMLVYQAVESIKIWTGKEAPMGVMLEAAEKALATFRTDHFNKVK